ncbi:hypothetical protein R3P38DRAFT_3207572 [Favolaschia claudopus]|uniref:Uncharacterized protein n=1 Tax=Favolaschia claudopus TaxID=2862362 RepID=A0AAV9ZSZ0_9AGAR
MKFSLTPLFVLASLSLANAQTVFHIVRTICSVESDPGGGIELDSSIQLLPDNFGCNTHAAAETDDVASWPHVLSFDGNPFGFGPLDFFLDANSGGYYAYHHGQAVSPLVATCAPESGDKICFIGVGSCDLAKHFRCVAPPQ